MRIRVIKPPQNAWDKLCQQYGEHAFSGRDHERRPSHGGRDLAVLGGNTRYLKGNL